MSCVNTTCVKSIIGLITPKNMSLPFKFGATSTTTTSPASLLKVSIPVAKSPQSVIFIPNALIGALKTKVAVWSGDGKSFCDNT